jgi:uncharacterized protein YceH (UPF0502 family)
MSAPTSGEPWPVLDVNERRVLGVLVEKAKTTPDAYPMSLNAVVTGSNQKSNRDPLLNLVEEEAEEALMRCARRGLTSRIQGGRVERWRHLLYEAWHVDKTEISVLAELLLRGPQTEGELRTRASRMEPIEDLDALRRCLRPLVERKLVVYLTPEDRRGAMLTHGFHSPQELERLRREIGTSAPPPPVPAVPGHPAPVAAPVPPPARSESAPPALEAGLAEALRAIAALRTENAGLTKQLADLNATVAALAAELRTLKQALGV